MSKHVSRRPSRVMFVAGMLLVFTTTPSWGQSANKPVEREDAEPREEERRRAHDGYRPERYDDEAFIDYDSEPPYDYYERYPRRLARDYKRARFRYYGSYGRGWRYGRPGWRYRYGPHGGYGYDHYGDRYGPDVFDYGYLEGRRDGRRFAEWERRYELGRRSYTDAMSEGLVAFRNGDYSVAARSFIRAAKLNQGDPASRIHAAHAMVAIGRYHRALPALRRAFQLQPKIAYLALDIRRDYGVKGDFQAHVNELRRTARETENDSALWLLLGYYEFYSGREGDALDALYKADELTPGDFMTEALLDAAASIAPAPKRPAKAEAPN